VDQNFFYILMEYVPGGDLFDAISQMVRFPPITAKLCAAEIIHAIEHLHQMEVIYRDLKPENVLVDANGHVKLTDFGYSKQLRRNERSYSICGTPG
jgi:serine/threonine protein kinase